MSTDDEQATVVNAMNKLQQSLLRMKVSNMKKRTQKIQNVVAVDDHKRGRATQSLGLTLM